VRASARASCITTSFVILAQPESPSLLLSLSVLICHSAAQRRNLLLALVLRWEHEASAPDRLSCTHQYFAISSIALYRSSACGRIVSSSSG
jgi:hypothetical protein